MEWLARGRELPFRISGGQREGEPRAGVTNPDVPTLPGRRVDVDDRIGRLSSLGTRATEPKGLPKQIRNPAITKLRSCRIFKTLNQAKLFWDPQAKPKGLLCGHLNVQSMIPKREQIEHLLTGSNIHALGLCETWLRKSSPLSAISMPDYQVFRKDRVKDRWGGVLLYVKSTLKCTLLPVRTELECLCVDISLSTEMSFVLVYLYRPPDAKVIFYDQLEALLKDVSALNKEVILYGDVNINWDIKSIRKNLKKTTDHFSLSQLIEKPTRITSKSQTRIDLLFTNKPERITKTYNLLTGIADHNAIFFTRKLSKMRFSTSLSNSAKPNPSQVFIPKNQQPGLAIALSQFNWAQVLACEETDACCDLFNKTVKEIVTPFTSRGRQKTKKNHTLPWLEEESIKLMKARDLLLKQSLKSGLTTDRQRYTSMRNKVTQTLRMAKSRFFLKLFENAQGNGKQIWNNLNKLTGRDIKQSSDLELRIGNTLVEDPATLAPNLKSIFSGISP